MERTWERYRKWGALLASGGITFGWVAAFGGVNFAEVATTFLSQLFSLLIAALLGGNVQELVQNFLTSVFA